MGKLKINARTVQIGLGLLWLLDGALQLQPQMFTSAFANQVILPAAQGQPGFVYSMMHLGVRLVLTHPAVFDALFAGVQLALGGLILYKRTTKIGLIASVGWAFIVWSLGEGFGGVFSDRTVLLMGAPGAALIYLVLALAVLPKKGHAQAKRTPAYWLAFVWLIFWLAGAIYQLLPGQNSIGDLGAMVSSNALGAPGWLAAADRSVGNWITHLGHYASHGHTIVVQMAGMSMSAPQPPGTSNPGFLLVLVFALIMAAVGFGVLLPRNWRKAAIAVGLVLSLGFWVFGQSLGGYYSGTATDPGTAPLFGLLGIAILGGRDLDRKLLYFGKRLSNHLLGREAGLPRLTVEPTPLPEK